jgi:hypothetical protein
MNLQVLPYLLSADRAHMFRNMGSGFREKQENFNPAELVLWLLLLVGLFWSLNALSRFLARRDKRQRPLYNSPRALFRTLCRVHKIDRPGRRLLKRLAAHRGLTYPAQIFLEPDAFNPAAMPAALQACAAQLTALQRTLFGLPQRPLSELPVHSEALEIALETSRREAAGEPQAEAMHKEPADPTPLPFGLPIELVREPSAPLASPSSTTP